MSHKFAPHCIEIKVRGYHLDLYGHVNNARYLEFLEEARWALTEQYGSLAYFAARKLAFVIVNININYRHAATMSDELLIETAVKKIGSRSAVMHQIMRLKNAPETVVADADITFVMFDGNKGAAIALEGEERVMLEKLPCWPRGTELTQ